METIVTNPVPLAENTHPRSLTGKLKRRAIMLAVAVASVGSLGVLLASQFGDEPSLARPGEKIPLSQKNTPGSLPVEVVRPAKGGLPRTIVQTGSLEAYETAELYSRISGYLDAIHVDIGDRVKEGQVLAEIDAPELIKDVQRQKALLQQAQSRTLQAKARIKAVEAERLAAEGAVRQAEADVHRQQAEHVRLRLGHSARPEPVDEHPVAVGLFVRLVDALAYNHR